MNVQELMHALEDACRPLGREPVMLEFSRVRGVLFLHLVTGRRGTPVRMMPQDLEVDGWEFRARIQQFRDALEVRASDGKRASRRVRETVKQALTEMEQRVAALQAESKALEAFLETRLGEGAE